MLFFLSVLGLLKPKSHSWRRFSLKNKKIMILKVNRALRGNSQHIPLTIGSDVLH